MFRLYTGAAKLFQTIPSVSGMHVWWCWRWSPLFLFLLKLATHRQAILQRLNKPFRLMTHFDMKTLFHIDIYFLKRFLFGLKWSGATSDCNSFISKKIKTGISCFFRFESKSTAICCRKNVAFVHLIFIFSGLFSQSSLLRRIAGTTVEINRRRWKFSHKNIAILSCVHSKA